MKKLLDFKILQFMLAAMKIKNLKKNTTKRKFFGENSFLVQKFKKEEMENKL